MQNMCMAVPRGTREVSFAPKPIFIGAENEGDNWSTRAPSSETSEVSGDDTVDGPSTATNVADRRRRLLPNALQPRQPSIPPLPVPAAVNFWNPFNNELSNDPLFGQLQFGPVPAPQPEGHLEKVKRELNEPAAPKKDVFAGSDPKPHIEQMLEAVHRHRCKIEYRLFKRKDLQNLHKNPNALLKAVRNYLHTNFMPENRSYIMINGQRVLKRQNFIDRIIECMKTALNHGNKTEVQESLYALSSIIKTTDNPPTINKEIMNVSDYINRLEDITQNIVILSKVYKKYLNPNIEPLGGIITSFLI